MSIEKEINKASLILKKNNIESARLDSEILMSSAIQKDRKFVILNSNQKLKKNSFNHFKTLVNKRSQGFKKLVADSQTPKGLNMQVLNELKKGGLYNKLTRALDNINKRVSK